jgi:hypothetical protein
MGELPRFRLEDVVGQDSPVLIGDIVTFVRIPPLRSFLFPRLRIWQTPRGIKTADEVRLAGLAFELNGGVIDMESISEECVDVLQNLGAPAGHLILDEDMGAQGIDP